MLTENDYQYLISRITHEIRNPLTLLYSTLQLMEVQHPEVKDFRHWHCLMEDTEYMISLLQEFSSYNNGERLSLSDIPFSEFMEHLALSFAAKAVDSSLEFTSLIEPDLPVIQADRTKLTQVFLNLLGNAAEALRETPGGTIRLCARRFAETLLITVEDNGCGIPPEQLDSIFTPFVTYKTGGTGLGLAISRRIIEAHGGHISVQSTAGEGSIFAVTLPIEQNSKE